MIPAEIRARYGLTPGTQVEFVDEGGAIRLHERRWVEPSDPAAGYGMVNVKPLPPGSRARRLTDFDLAVLLERPRGRK